MSLTYRVLYRIGLLPWDDWLSADVTRLEQIGLAPGFTLLFDRGPYHGLSGLERDAYGAGVTALAAPGATMLIRATAPSRRPLEPAGADATEIAGRFASWKLRGALVADETGAAGPRTSGAGASRGVYDRQGSTLPGSQLAQAKGVSCDALRAGLRASSPG